MAAINELLPDDFIAAYTKFSSMQQWSLAWEEESGRPFNRLPALDQPHSRLDRFVNINTVFSGWREMYHYAFECWVARAAEKLINVSTFRPRPMPRFVDSPKSQTLDLNQSSNVDRIFGAVMIIGAIPEALTGAALIAFPEPVTGVLGVVVVTHAADSAATGFLMLITGKPQQTQFSKAGQLAFEAAGASETTAYYGGEAFDTGVGLFMPSVAAKNAQRVFKLRELDFLTKQSEYFRSFSSKTLGFTDIFEPVGVDPSRLAAWSEEVVRNTKNAPTIAVGRRGRFAISGWTHDVAVPYDMIATLGSDVVDITPQQSRALWKQLYEIEISPSVMRPETHAEMKLFVTAGDERIFSLNKPPCASCTRGAMAKANVTGQRQLLDTPEGIYVIEPNKVPNRDLAQAMNSQQVWDLLGSRSANPVILKGVHIPQQYARKLPPYVQVMGLPIVGSQLAHAIRLAKERAPGAFPSDNGAEVRPADRSPKLW